MSRKFRIGGSSKSLKDWWKEKKDEEAAKSAETRENGWKDVTSQADDDYKSIKFQMNSVGEMAPITTTNPLAEDAIVFGGSKSSLRRIADLERNVSVLASKLTTTDGEASDTNDNDFDTVVNKDTKFKKDVQLGNGSGDAIHVYGSMSINSNLTLGSTAQEVVRDLIGGMVSTGLVESDSGNTITVDETRISTRSYVDSSIAALADSAPATLNTLNELAAALGDDANFATTVNNNIAAKVAKTSAQALRATDAITVSNDTITIHKGDGTSEAVTVSDANSDNYLTGASFSTSNGVLTLSRTNGNVTVDLDGRFTDNGYADTMNQHVRTTDSPTFANVTATAFNGTATYAKYADLAERYAADAEYAEGTVMAFGGDAEVTAAAGYGSGKLAGVVSHKPAVAMNAEAGNDQTHPYIALQGRVPVRVEGDVKKGDILVASDIAGLAAVWMNADADPRMTAYVGIAISDSADGMVEVKVGK
ncbi:hypothetical protein N9R43_01945 [bacterium]|nr:hypothetical protein [bacterium]